jgi:hypothetical protein
MIPKRRKPTKMNCNSAPQIRSAGHLKWIRGHECAVCGGFPLGYPIEAAHVRTGTDGGMGVKPGDNWTLPLCSHHHRNQHLIGEAEFEAIFGIDMKAIAGALWQKSPHRLKVKP